MSQFLLLVTSDHRPRKPTVPVPTTCFMPRIASGHPPQEFAVVDDEVSEVELMWVEYEGSDTQRQN